MASSTIDQKICDKCSGEEDRELPDEIQSLDPTPLMCAVYHGHIECIDELMKDKANRRPSVKKFGKSILLWAIKNCQNNIREVVKSLGAGKSSHGQGSSFGC